MSIWKALAIVIGSIIAVVAGMALLVHSTNVPLLEPQGQIGLRQRNLIYFALSLSLVVVIPVFVMLIMIITRYGEQRQHKDYQPEWDHNRLFESIWWGVPIVLIAILTVVTWISSYTLDPYRPIASTKRPLTVQVVALQWRWLFIYPEQNVASVNYLQLPVDRPIHFEITADAPMNSFWIPQLGGQIYAMPGMVTQLHLEADKPGDYRGVSANISGTGFSGMHFDVRTDEDFAFDAWVSDAKQSPASLDAASYDRLSKPTRDRSEYTFDSVQTGLFESVRMKFMMPNHSAELPHDMAGMEMH